MHSLTIKGLSEVFGVEKRLRLSDYLMSGLKNYPKHNLINPRKHLFDYLLRFQAGKNRGFRSKSIA
jgi:hypothetical protein